MWITRRNICGGGGSAPQATFKLFSIFRYCFRLLYGTYPGHIYTGHIYIPPHEEHFLNRNSLVPLTLHFAPDQSKQLMSITKKFLNAGVHHSKINEYSLFWRSAFGATLERLQERGYRRTLQGQTLFCPNGSDIQSRRVKNVRGEETLYINGHIPWTGIYRVSKRDSAQGPNTLLTPSQHCTQGQ